MGVHPSGQDRQAAASNLLHRQQDRFSLEGFVLVVKARDQKGAQGFWVDPQLRNVDNRAGLAQVFLQNFGQVFAQSVVHQLHVIFRVLVRKVDLNFGVQLEQKLFESR